jgi:hypothetical protein
MGTESDKRVNGARGFVAQPKTGGAGDSDRGAVELMAAALFLARSVDILGVEKGALAQTQSAGIDRGQAGPVHRKMDRGQNPVNFLSAQEHRHLLVFGRT